MSYAMEERIERLKAAQDAMCAEYDWVERDLVAGIESIYDPDFIDILSRSELHRQAIEVAAVYEVERSLLKMAEKHPETYERKRNEINRWDDEDDKRSIAVEMLHVIAAW